MVYNEFKRAIAAAEIDLLADDIYCKLVMSNTTCDTENDTITTLVDFTDMDEFDGATYADVLVANKTIERDDDLDAALFKADNPGWLGLGAGSRDIEGWLFYHDTSLIPLCFIRCQSTFSGGAYSVDLPATGIMRMG